MADHVRRKPIYHLGIPWGPRNLQRITWRHAERTLATNAPTTNVANIIAKINAVILWNTFHANETIITQNIPILFAENFKLVNLKFYEINEMFLFQVYS